MSKKLSIIIPAYNAAKYEERCIESIVSQGYNDVEILLVDDGSTDNTLQICNTLATKYPCIKVLHKENGGVSSARNLGIDNAQGEYLMFVDVDDYLLPGALPNAMAVAEAYPDADFCVFSFKRVSRKGDNSYCVFGNDIYSGKDFLNYIYINDVLQVGTPCAKLYKREHIVSNNLHFDTGMISFEDICFNLNVLKHSHRFITSDVIAYCYEVNNQSATAKFNGEVVIHNGDIYVSTLRNVISALSEHCNDNTAIEIIKEAERTVCFHILFEIYNLYRLSKVKGKYAWLKRLMGFMPEITPDWHRSFRSGFTRIVVQAYRLHPRCADLLLRSVFLIKK